LTSKTEQSGRAGARFTSVRAIRRLTKAEALEQFQQNPDLASTISGAARRWGCSRTTARQWIAEFTAPPVATAPAMAMPMAATGGAMAAPEAFKAALCHLADLVGTTTPQEILDSADPIELLGLHQDSELVAAYVGAIETLAGAALKRDH
jgi:transposase-like protein